MIKNSILNNSMLTIEILESDSSLENYSSIFSEYTNVKLPLDYLRNADVHLLKKSKKIIGGYAIVTNLPFRFISLLPENISSQDYLVNIFKHPKTCEVNGFFLKEPKYIYTLMQSISHKILNLQMEYVLLFYDANNIKLNNLWKENLHPFDVYIGKPNANSRLESHGEIYFGYVCRKNILSFHKRLTGSAKTYRIKRSYASYAIT